MSLDWLHQNATPLWDTRAMLGDDLSRLLFDTSLIIRMTNHRRFYFPRIDFDDLVDISNKQLFADPGFPHDYLGVPLGVFDVRFRHRPEQAILRIITREIQLALVNSYRQYLIRRDGWDISPTQGDVVLDCGACIGEVSMLLAGLVAPAGQVHLFDPIPLHARFCQLQTSLNPMYAESIHVNALAVGDQTHAGTGVRGESERIVPGAVIGSEFPCTTLDDYVANGPKRVDFIKMDIEGAEISALNGASSIIGEFRPRLAISGYHKPEDLWEIPVRLRELNPGYVLAFGHHTPIIWESVFYAIDQNAIARQSGRRSLT